MKKIFNLLSKFFTKKKKTMWNAGWPENTAVEISWDADGNQIERIIYLSGHPNYLPDAS